MKVSDFIVDFLEKHHVTDVFGYPGVGCGHFMDSLSRSTSIRSRLVYHEQAAAFAACAYAQAAHKIGIAYTTAGPGGTNLITGIANAYCDSIPTVFIVGDKDLSSLRGEHQVRQMASQEVDIVSITAPITKWSYQICRKEDIRYVLEKAFFIAEDGRFGPVLLDIPSDIQRDDIDPDQLRPFIVPTSFEASETLDTIASAINQAERPVLLVGNGVKQAGLENAVLAFAQKTHIPIVTTLVCVDLFAEQENNIGFIGLDGDKAANFAVDSCDLLISLGARLNFKQVRNRRASFAPHAQIIRVDCDQGELDYSLGDEIKICIDIRTIVPGLLNIKVKDCFVEWLQTCKDEKTDRRSPLGAASSMLLREFCRTIPENTSILVDTGSHRRWVFSEISFKHGQKFFQSAGLASMGYSLPAAIGAFYATGQAVVCFTGDGGIMMNLQELQMIDRERLPISVVVINNHCLGDIMAFQKRIFAGNYFMTTKESGYQSADFSLIAAAFHLKYTRISCLSDLKKSALMDKAPHLIEVIIPEDV